MNRLCAFFQGMDIGLEDVRTFDSCRVAYAAPMAHWGLQLIDGENECAGV